MTEVISPACNCEVSQYHIQTFGIPGYKEIFVKWEEESESSKHTLKGSNGWNHTQFKSEDFKSLKIAL